MAKVIVGMSGGIDSSVTAHLLRERGYDVEGVSLLMYEPRKGESARCSPRAIDEAAGIARNMGVRHEVIDVREEFAAQVIEPFLRAYLSGVTPNPCILCNRSVKFPALLRRALSAGADFIATGHYARLERQRQSAGSVEDVGADFPREAEGVPLLKKGIDQKKEQSYVLYALSRETLSALLLPLGNYMKQAVRRLGAEIGLPLSICAESQEICFLQGKKYLTFLREGSRAMMEPGPIVDQEGKVIGKHTGIYGYTIGQRKRLGIASQRPLYVTGLSVGSNTVFVGYREAAETREVRVDELNWLIDMETAREGEAATSFRATVKIRSTMRDKPATITLRSPISSPKAREEGLAIRRRVIADILFDEPQWAPAPGQSAVFYHGDTVIGGGIIQERMPP